ncbi:MAG: hypothetical protein DRO39_02435 [Thermoprotei archaeon]|nr:MAG: hypothetical protein DRO39_02435 [Thermoprotei archaeon]
MEWREGAVYRFALKSGKVLIARVEKVLRDGNGVYGLRLRILKVIRKPSHSATKEGDLAWVETGVIIRAKPVPPPEISIPKWFFEGG